MEWHELPKYNGIQVSQLINSQTLGKSKQNFGVGIKDKKVIILKLLNICKTVSYCRVYLLEPPRRGYSENLRYKADCFFLGVSLRKTGLF